MPEKIPMSVAEARATGTKFYDTGKPCKHGHVAPRRTSTKHCTVCERISNLMAPAPPANKRREYHGRWRRKARANKGLTYHGKPCRACGNSERYTTSGECVSKRFHDTSQNSQSTGNAQGEYTMTTKPHPNRIEVLADDEIVHTCLEGPEAQAVARQFKKQSDKVVVRRYEDDMVWDEEEA